MNPLTLTLGARDFSGMVSGFWVFFIVWRCVGLWPTLKIPASREKNLWYPVQLSLNNNKKINCAYPWWQVSLGQLVRSVALFLNMLFACNLLVSQSSSYHVKHTLWHFLQSFSVKKGPALLLPVLSWFCFVFRVYTWLITLEIKLESNWLSLILCFAGISKWHICWAGNLNQTFFFVKIT